MGKRGLILQRVLATTFFTNSLRIGIKANGNSSSSKLTTDDVGGSNALFS